MLIKRLILALALALPLPAAAQSLDDVVSVDILPGWTTRSGSQMAGLAIRLAPGWKTYWRAPGDAGIPPMISYTGSENVTTARMQWPVPEVFYTNNMRSIGYHGQVILPLELTRSQPGQMRLTGTLSIGICQDICVPAHLSFDAILPEGGDRDPLIVAALVDRPLRADEAGVSTAVCDLRITDSGVTLQADIRMPAAGATEEVVIETGDPRIWVSEPVVSRAGETLSAAVTLAHVDGTAFAVDRSGIRITVLGSDHAVDIRGCTAG